MGWLVAVAFLGAVVSAVAVAVFGAAEHSRPVAPDPAR
ncbi:putative membrane protein [Mycobacteroides abscessus 1948]|nr:putative membrane protein [Mycobacteroides abscessus 1948]